MKKTKEEKHNIWWASLDGDLNAEQKSEFEKKRNQDFELDSHYLEAQKLDQALKKIETEEPSMRFTQKVMEALPFIYRKINIEPLLNSRMFWIIASSIFVLVVLTIIPAFFVSGEYAAEYLNTISNLSERFTQLPSKWFVIASALSIGFIGVLTMDRSIKKMILRSKKA